MKVFGPRLHTLEQLLTHALTETVNVCQLFPVTSQSSTEILDWLAFNDLFIQQNNVPHKLQGYFRSVVYIHIGTSEAPS